MVEPAHYQVPNPTESDETLQNIRLTPSKMELSYWTHRRLGLQKVYSERYKWFMRQYLYKATDRTTPRYRRYICTIFCTTSSFCTSSLSSNIAVRRASRASLTIFLGIPLLCFTMSLIASEVNSMFLVGFSLRSIL
jgi:hypothetical protein